MAYRAFKPEYFDRMVRKAKAGPVPFAFAHDAEDNPVFALDEELEGKALFGKMKSETGATRGAWGTAAVLGSTWELRCEKWVSGMVKGLKALAKENGWTAKNFSLLDAAGKPIGEDAPAAGEAPAPMAAAAAASVPPAPATPPPSEEPVPEEEAPLTQRDLTVRDPKELFTPEYMDGLIGLKVKGANDPDLKDIMRQLGKGMTGTRKKELIAQLAKIRGSDPVKLGADYDKFLTLRDQQEAVRKSKKGMEPIPDLAEDIHGDFLGSNPQLVYGKVVGDAFGIDPVFGALLNPTGGMVGPGNAALHMDDDDPTGYHGIVHDAAGYMYNFHNQGPGYNYLDGEDRDTADPLTGQQSGMRYWHEKLDPGIKTAAMTGVIDLCYSARDLVKGKGGMMDKVGKVAETAAKTAQDLARATAQAAEAKAREAAGLAAKTAAEAAAKAEALARAAAAKAAQAVEQVRAEVEKSTQGARDAVAGAVQTALETGGAAAGAAGAAATEVAQAAAAAAQSVGTAVVEKVGNAAEVAGNIADAAAAKANAAWNTIWS